MRQAMIGTKVAGRVQEIRVQEHDEVKKDQILAVIEHYDLDAMIEQRKANLEKCKADLEEAKAELWEKQREATRAERLVAKKMVNQEDFEKASSAQKMCTAKVASLEAMIKVQQANLKEMEYTLKYQMHIMAPVRWDGRREAGRSRRGDQPDGHELVAGRSAVVTIADLRNIDVETDISENLMSRIQLGQPAEVSVSAVPSKRYKGELRQIIPLGDRTRGTVKVKVKIVDPDDKLFPELAATVHFLPFKSGGAPTPTSPTCSCRSRPSFRRTGMTSSGSSTRSRTWASGKWKWRRRGRPGPRRDRPRKRRVGRPQPGEDTQGPRRSTDRRITDGEASRRILSP